jgi:glycosyltransferase involved in cell wall biosynthesis
VSVVLPTYNEKDSIAGVIRGFEALGVVDEIVVVNNNAAPGTSEEVARTSAREVVETTQGYGAAIRRGLREATGDLIAVCEPDGTFDPDDLFKLLTYTKESDFVVGSRTVSTFIWDGANMGWFLQFGNWTVAKMIEASFNTTSLSDVGCTFRVITRELAQALEPEFTHTGSAFGLEMLLVATRRHVRVVQIPVNYLPRVGESSVTGDFRKTLSLGFRMIGMVGRARASRVPPLPVQYRRPSTGADATTTETSETSETIETTSDAPTVSENAR